MLRFYLSHPLGSPWTRILRVTFAHDTEKLTSLRRKVLTVFSFTISLNFIYLTLNFQFKTFEKYMEIGFSIATVVGIFQRFTIEAVRIA